MMSTMGDESPFLGKMVKMSIRSKRKKLFFQLLFSTYLLVYSLKFRSGALVGWGIQFRIQRVLLVEIWVNTQGYMSKIWVEKIVFSFWPFLTFLPFYPKMVIHPPWLTSTPSILLVDFYGTFILFWGPFFTSKFL